MFEKIITPKLTGCLCEVINHETGERLVKYFDTIEDNLINKTIQYHGLNNYLNDNLSLLANYSLQEIS